MKHTISVIIQVNELPIQMHTIPCHTIECSGNVVYYLACLSIPFRKLVTRDRYYKPSQLFVSKCSSTAIHTKNTTERMLHATHIDRHDHTCMLEREEKIKNSFHVQSRIYVNEYRMEWKESFRQKNKNLMYDTKTSCKLQGKQMSRNFEFIEWHGRIFRIFFQHQEINGNINQSEIHNLCDRNCHPEYLSVWSLIAKMRIKTAGIQE